MVWIDISQPLTNDIGHWPGDVPFTYSLSYTKKQTDSVNIGKITTSLHTGTHVDAPYHFDETGKTVDQLPIDTFIGPARVIDMRGQNHITPNDFEQKHLHHIKRLLIKTALSSQPKQFPKKIPTFDPQLASFFSKQGIKLLGVDLPSVDPLSSKQLYTHHALHQKGIHILENIMLDSVEEGLYQLVAVPLAIIGADGSPVRAVIRQLKEEGEK